MQPHRPRFPAALALTQSLLRAILPWARNTSLTISIKVEFSGGLELIFAYQRTGAPSNDGHNDVATVGCPVGIAYLIQPAHGAAGAAR